MEKLLIIDDSKLILEVLKRANEESGKFTSFFASSYNEAKELLKIEKFDVAIVDLELPDCKSGEAVDLTISYKIPTIVLTGTLNSQLRDEIVQKPIVDYIVKGSLEDINHSIAVAENLSIFKNQKVLVIDDDTVSRKFIKSLFKMLSFDVVEASGGKEALEILKIDNNFSLITVDYNMPEMNGIKFLQSIQKINFKQRPIFFGVTSSQDERTKMTFLKSGANDVFTKPILKEEFNLKIGNIIRLTEQQRDMTIYLDLINKHVISSTTNLDGIIVYVSEAFCQISGYTKEELIGKNHNIVRHSDMPISIYQDLWNTIKLQKSWSGDIKNLKKDGGFYWVSVTIEPIYNRLGVHIGYSAIRQDITDKKLVEQLAITDKLTQIYNRIHLDKILHKEIENSKNNNKQFSIILLDIDKFKSVNDTYGHQAGDSVLKETAKILSKNIRQSDTLGRWGGEEFLIILPNTNLEEAKNIAEGLRVAMENFDFLIISKKTGSFGVSVFRENDSEESLLKRADDALYFAKENGRNRVVCESIYSHTIL